MRNIFLVAAAIALPLAIPAQTAFAQEIRVSASNPVVAIGVTESEEAKPDIATINAGVQADNADAKKAADETNRTMEKILAVVRAAGIEAKDIQTTGASVGEQFDYSGEKEVSKGFRAYNVVTLKIRDLAKLQALLSDLVDAGANDLSGPYFDVDDGDALTDKARMAAFDTAKRRATAYATKAGFKSVRLLQVNEGAFTGMEYAYGAAAEAAADAAAAAGAAAVRGVADTPIEPGLTSRTVTATFHFEMVP